MSETPRLHYARVEGQTLDEIRDNVRKTHLYEMGDCILVWVNEGDFWLSGVVDASLPTPPTVAEWE